VLILSALAAPGPAAAFIDPPAPKGLDAGPVLPLSAEPRVGDGLEAGRGHEGVDLFAPAGTPLVAVDDAVVLESASDGGRGNYVSIFDPARDRTYNYLHMLRPARVSRGARVQAGQQLGELGCTGSCWGNHLHFELRVGRGPSGPVLDPIPFVAALDPRPRRLPAALR
jgi:murein DD-endopeptidase MepM/ murein hydrolase activator NlpD